MRDMVTVGSPGAVVAMYRATISSPRLRAVTVSGWAASRSKAA